MKIYQIAGKQYAVSGDNIYEQVQEFDPDTSGSVGMLAGIPVSVSYTGPFPIPKKYQKKAPKVAKPKKAGRGPRRGQIHCKVCDGYGHFAKTCPERKPEAKKIKPGREEGLVESTDIRTQVQEMKAAGKTSIVIAQELGITLAEVNKHW